MPEPDTTRPATWEDVKHVAVLLEQHGAFVEQKDIDGVPLRLLGLEGLLRTKEGQRDKDRADAAILRAALDALRERSG